ncbi:hypothetical protein MMP66_05295 [Acinetobacter dispersus]|uniref:hypothetical protein n=1 Tax=Acinetobacter dispersus TaxID=70348 RepID=UPI001F4B038C|nr:hypothetical protein [Acinetobacter dispersus]MCH7393698.1 hypothetical protein [Acinetobacter dispersus]
MPDEEDTEFTAQDTGRQFETNKLKINPSGISVEANFPLQKNENPKNCTVRINVYLPTGRLLEPRPFVGTTYKKESGSSVKHTLHEVKLVTHHTSQEKDHSIDKIAVNRSVHPPEGLYTVAYYNTAINASAAKYGVDPMTIGSIVFQEKFYSSAAIAKNYVAYAKDKFGVKPHRSYGLGEMQLGLAAKLLGFPESDSNRLRKTFDLITNDPQVATDMVAKNIQLKQLKLGRQLTPREATILHNAGESGLDSFLDPAEDNTNFENPKKSIIAQEIGRNQSGKLYEELFTLSQTVAQLVLRLHAHYINIGHPVRATQDYEKFNIKTLLGAYSDPFRHLGYLF